MKYKSILASSSDKSGETLSKTVDGLITLLSALVPLFALRFFHVTITADDINTLVTQAVAIGGAIMTVRGVVLKLVNRYGTQQS